MLSAFFFCASCNKSKIAGVNITAWPGDFASQNWPGPSRWDPLLSSRQHLAFSEAAEPTTVVRFFGRHSAWLSGNPLPDRNSTVNTAGIKKSTWPGDFAGQNQTWVPNEVLLHVDSSLISCHSVWQKGDHDSALGWGKHNQVWQICGMEGLPPNLVTRRA